MAPPGPRRSLTVLRHPVHLLSACVFGILGVEAEQTVTTTTTSVRCAALRDSCTGCIAAGCNFCEVSSMMQRDPETLTDEQIAAQQAALDYACVQGSCQNLLMTRPGAVYFKFLFNFECPAHVGSTETVTTTVTVAAPPSADQFLGLTKSQSEEDETSWPNSWGAAQWGAVTVPPLILASILCGLYWRCRFQEKASRRVYAAADASGGERVSSSDAPADLDFCKAGPLTPERISEIDVLLRESAVAAKRKGWATPTPSVAFAASNALARPHLLNLVSLLDVHKSVTLRLDMDWRGAADGDLKALATLLSRRGRCVLRPTAGRASGAGRLRMPQHASAAALGDLSEALAVAGHGNVDSVSMEAVAGRPSEGAATVVLDLTPLRLSCQELALNRQKVGDGGCAVACGFVRPWAGRLVSIRLLECNVGDDGACELGRLLSGRPEVARDPSAASAAGSLRELILSANRIGDRGIAKIAEALPRCDGLERILLDRNHVGPFGARALARNLKRSNVRELVLGSHLGGNPLGALGAEALADAMGDGLDRAAADRAHRLEALNVESCDIGMAGARILAQALPTSGIVLLSMASDSLTDAGAAAILQAAPPAMRSLDLAGNDLSDFVAGLAGETLQRIPALGLSLAQNDLSAAMKSMLREAHGQRLRV